MWSDLKLLIGLDRQRIGKALEYWIKILGIDGDETYAYQLYVWAFYAFWVFAMWSYIVESVFEFQRLLPDTLIVNNFDGITFLFPLVFTLYLLWLLRDPPLKLTAPDIAILATSPIRRGVITLVYGLRAIIPLAFLTAVISSLYALIVIWSLEVETVVQSSLLATLIAFMLFVSIGAIGWTIAIMPLKRLTWQERGIIYGGVALVLIVIVGLPLFGGFPLATYLGWLWFIPMTGAQSAPALLIAAAIMVAAIAALYFSGQGVHLAIVTEQSRTYARVQKLGMLGRFYVRDLITRIKQQERLAKRRRFLRMPRTNNRFLALFSRSLVSQWRTMGWRMLLMPFTGVAFVGIAILPILLADVAVWQSWLALLIFIVRRRPSGLVQQYAQHSSSAFMGQFQRGNTITVVLANSILPMGLVALGAVGFLLLLPSSAIALDVRLIGALLAIACVGIATWAQVINLLHQRIAYEITILVSALAIILSGIFTQTIDVPFFTALAINVIMLRVIQDSE